MARENRIVVEDGLYHVTARIANRAMLLADDGVKSRIVDWIYGIADFAGVEVLAWNLMDNHIHLFLHVPPPPRGLSPSGREPSSSAFSMRPCECRAPRWQPDVSDAPVAITPAGDSPSEEAVRLAVANGEPVVRLPRPETGFAMSDEAMVARLESLYAGTGRSGAASVARRWMRMREEGRGDEVEAEKDAYCRRMYNVSQYMKTLKQRISEHFNRRLGHSGALWEGRFYSGLVDDEDLARLFVTAYIDWNAPKARLAGHPKDWKWCSFAMACGDSPHAGRARRGYELALGCGWEGARRRLESVFADRLPDSYDPRKSQTHYEVVGPDGVRRMVPLRMSHLIKLGHAAMKRGGFISRKLEFAKSVLAKLPPKFPHLSDASIRSLREYDWSLPASAAA